MEAKIADFCLFLYNIMMRRVLIAIALTLIPATAGAQYLTPEDVLSLSTSYYQRVNPRNAPKIVQDQQRRATPTQRVTGYEWWEQAQEPETQPIVIDEITPHLVEAQVKAQNANDGYVQPLHAGAGLSPTTIRLLERLERNNRYDNNYYVASPIRRLSHTGPEAYLTLLAMVPAGYWTLRRARRMHKFIRN